MAVRRDGSELGQDSKGKADDNVLWSDDEVSGN